MPSLGSGEATAVARTTLSPLVVSAAPEACLAIRPVSNLICLPPASSTVTSCFMVLLFSFKSSFHRWNLFAAALFRSARKKIQPGLTELEPSGELHCQNLYLEFRNRDN